MTYAGLPPQSVAPIPPGTLIPVSELARRGEFANMGHLLGEIKDGNAPALPFHQRYAGVEMVGSDAAQDWLQDLAQLRLGADARKAAKQAKATADYEAALAAKAMQNAADAAQAADRFKLFARRIREEVEARRRAASGGGEAIIIDANGRRVR